MDSDRKKKSKTYAFLDYGTKIAFMACLVIGIVFTFLMIYFVCAGKGNDVVTAQAKITDKVLNSQNSYVFQVTFDYQGQTLVKETSFITSLFNIGDTIEIYFDPSVENYTVNSYVMNHMVAIIYAGVSALFYVIAFLVYFIPKRINHKKEELLHDGNYVNAKLIDIRENLLYTMGYKHPFQLILQYSEGNQTYTFKSENLWEDPTNHIKEHNIGYFRVYLNRKNFKRYYVDIEHFLPGNEDDHPCYTPSVNQDIEETNINTEA